MPAKEPRKTTCNRWPRPKKIGIMPEERHTEEAKQLFRKAEESARLQTCGAIRESMQRFALWRSGWIPAAYEEALIRHAIRKVEETYGPELATLGEATHETLVSQLRRAARDEIDRTRAGISRPSLIRRLKVVLKREDLAGLIDEELGREVIEELAHSA